MQEKQELLEDLKNKTSHLVNEKVFLLLCRGKEKRVNIMMK